MEAQQFTELLMKALDDPEVKKKLQAVVTQENPSNGLHTTQDIELERLRSENDKLGKEKAQMQSALEQANLKLAGLKADLNQMGSTLQSKNGELAALQQKLEQYQELLKTADDEKIRAENRLKDVESAYQPFRSLNECYQQYHSLPDGLLKFLSPSLPCDDPILFWAAGCQRDRLFQLWDAVAQRAEKLPTEQIQIIVDLLAFFLAQYNALWSTPVYELMLNETGERFDDLRHTRSSGCSLYQGTVARVLLPGIWIPGLNRAEKKCIVQF